MFKGFIAVLSIALTVFALADCVQTQDDKIRGIPKWAWIVLIVLLPWVGPITWLVVGRDRTGGSAPQRPQRRGPSAPDEDPDFLRKLDEDIRRERRNRDQGGQGGQGEDPAGPDAPHT